MKIETIEIQNKKGLLIEVNPNKQENYLIK
jgi:hypothetical protein